MGVGRQADGGERRDRRSRHRPAGRRRRERLVLDCVREYREAMRGFARESHLDVWYERLNASELVERFGGRLGQARAGSLFAEAVRQGAAQDEPAGGQEAHRARRRPAALSAASRRCWSRSASCSTAPTTSATRPSTSASCSTATPPASTPTGATCSRPTGSWTWPARWSASAASARARGCSCSSAADGKDPLVLQAKEAQASVLEPYLGASEFANHGERVVRGQRIAQAATDIFLSWQRSRGPRRQGARLLRPPAVGLEGVGRPRRR